MEQIRSFIAIELPAEIKAELASLEEKLKAGQHPFVKWVDPESIHLTLKFLGNISLSDVPKIIKALSSAAKGASPFSLNLGKQGAFPNFRRPNVVWVGIGGEVEKLALLQRTIESALAPLGFTPDNRDFSPHLTLGRVKQVSPKEKQDFGRFASSIECEEGSPFEVKGFSLIKSKLTSDGAIYTQLASIELRG